jgi:hypothetical protein
MLDDYLPRLKRRINESWVPLGTGSRAATPRADSRSSTSTRTESRTSERTGSQKSTRMNGITVARVEGPPNFLDPYPAPSEEDDPTSRPPSYAQLRNIARPEIANLLPGSRVSYGRPGAIMNATPRQSLVATSSNIASLDDIRHIEIAHHLHMANRLSSVPQYPVYLDSAHPLPTRRRQSARPDSTLSMGAAGVMLSVGQIPGSEPFQMVPPQQQSPALRDWRRVQSTAGSPVTGRSRPRTAVTHIADVRQQTPAPAPRVQRPYVNRPPSTSWFDSAISSALSSREQVNASIRESYNPLHLSHRGTIQKAQDSRDNERAVSAHVRFADSGVDEYDEPPPPPPKDEGYGDASQQGRHKLKHSLSCLSLRSTLSQRRSRRSKFFTSEKPIWDDDGNKLRRSKSGEFTDAEKFPAGSASANMGSRISAQCAGFLSRSIPRVVAC